VLVCVASCLLVVAGSAGAAAGGEGFAASPGTATASGDCSKTTALEVAKPFFVWGSDVRDPIRQVLCGPFTGPGSEAMAVTFTAPTCWPVQGWAVYRFTGSDWQLVTVQRGAFIFPLFAVGADIRETAPVFRSGDPRCLPSGGRHARIWHWNGTSLTAGPWKQATRPAAGATLHLYQFVSPSHNLFCRLGDEDLANCLSKRSPHTVALSKDGKLRICRGARCVCSAPQICSVVPVPTLGYGKQNVYAGFRCLSQRSGVTCTVIRTGKGFLINNKTIRRVGP